VDLHGPLSFLTHWTYFTEPSNPAFEDLTASGPYAGTTQAFTTGQKLRTRYDHLVNQSRTTTLWTCSSQRDIETAEYFARGFFGSHWHDDKSAHIVVVPETPDRGADTLTPGDTCLGYREDKATGHDYGYIKLALWQEAFSKRIIARLQKHAADVVLSAIDIYSMMEMCGFEILARGSSPWCDVFSQDEWDDFEYGRDLLHFYRAGPGNKFAGVMGFLWLNATQELLSNDAARGVYFSFAHDGDIVPLMATLGILNEDGSVQTLPADRRKRERNWRTSDIVPMGGRTIFERIICDEDAAPYLAGNTYIKLSINDGVMENFTGSGERSNRLGTRLDDFQRFVQVKAKEFGDFRDVCGLSADAPPKITFLHQ